MKFVFCAFCQPRFSALRTPWSKALLPYFNAIELAGLLYIAGIRLQHLSLLATEPANHGKD